MRYLGKITDNKDLVTKEYVDGLLAALADIASSGEADDVSITDSAGYFTSTNVEDALAELYGSISGSGTVVTMNTWVASA